MSLFSNLTTEGHEAKEDRLGGFRLLSTNAYEGTIKMAYVIKSDGGAMGITLVADIDGTQFTKTEWITNRKGENWFHPKDKDGKPNTSKKNSLPGFTIIDDLCIVTTGKSLSEQEHDEKVVKIYNSEEKKELPTSVNMLTELIDQKAYFLIFEDLVNKNEKNDAGVYVATAESRGENTIDKIAHYPSKVTVKEALMAQKAEEEGVKPSEPVFFDGWVDKNVTKHKAANNGESLVRDRREIKDGAGGVKNGRPGQSGGAPQAGGQERKTNSLFGGKK